jgi:hypothetical protein
MTLVEPFRASREAFKRELPLPPGNTFTRVLTARVLAQLRNTTPQQVADQMWPSDRLVAQVVEKASVAPAMTSVAGWAAELAVRVVHDALEALGPASAGADLLKRGLVLTFDGAGSISAPGFVAEFGNAGWVAEGQPIPVRQLSSTAAVLNPHKLAAIGVLTREMIESSNAEALVTDALVRAAGRMLDEVLFDANPEDAARPRGLRNGVSASTPSSNTTAFEAAYEDIATLINSVAPVAGNGPVILVGSPGRAAMMASRFDYDADDPGSKVTVLGSSAVINDLLAVAPAALVTALSPEPDVEASKAAQIVMDTVPGAAGVAGPINKSMFQSDAIAVKVRWPVTWALRDSRGFAWMTPTWK